ncbi:MAG: lysine--tRNA ligase, partial [Azoarcus sp.]|nr:lysine--tRNA ligase [Azoarcus sp.]
MSDSSAKDIPSTLQDENHIVAERREKLAQWRAGGQAFPNDFARENTAGKLDELYGDKDAEALEAMPV